VAARVCAGEAPVATAAGGCEVTARSKSARSRTAAAAKVPGPELAAMRLPEDETVVDSMHTNKRQVQEPGLRRYEAVHVLAHGARVKVMDNVEHWRIVHQALVGDAIRSIDRGRIARFRKPRQCSFEFVVLPVFEIEAIGGEVVG
jgi:hypothetical protein